MEDFELTPKVVEAIDFALGYYKDQLDKGGKPSFGHPLRIALRVAHLGEAYFITALLHDLVEDFGVTISEIAHKFGIEIAFAVNSVTRKLIPVKEKYINLIERASLNKIGREVKLADLEDNMMPERIDALPPEMRDIIKRYKRAKKYILAVKKKEWDEHLRLQHEQMLIDGGGA